MDERVLIGSEGLPEVDQASSTDAECKEGDRKYVSKKKKNANRRISKGMWMKVNEVQAGSEWPRTDEDTEVTSKSGADGLQKKKPFDFF